MDAAHPLMLVQLADDTWQGPTPSPDKHVAQAVWFNHMALQPLVKRPFRCDRASCGGCVTRLCLVATLTSLRLVGCLWTLMTLR